MPSFHLWGFSLLHSVSTTTNRPSGAPAETTAARATRSKYARLGKPTFTQLNIPVLNSLRSAWIWLSTAVLVVVWTPLLALRRLLDRDPVHYATGRLFRDLGVTMVRLNPYWHVDVSGRMPDNPRRPYVVVSNHQSAADIPFLSHLPWEMKWLAKTELFRMPFAGWMLRLAGDIRVDRDEPRKSVIALRQALWYLERNCSVMVFPEGTRSPDGRVHSFVNGAALLAVDAGVPILPVAIDGSFACLPKQTWKFGPVDSIRIGVLPSIETQGFGRDRIEELTRAVRSSIISQIAEWRGVSPDQVDASENDPLSAT